MQVAANVNSRLFFKLTREVHIWQAWDFSTKWCWAYNMSTYLEIIYAVKLFISLACFCPCNFQAGKGTPKIFRTWSSEHPSKCFNFKSNSKPRQVSKFANWYIHKMCEVCIVVRSIHQFAYEYCYQLQLESVE